MATVVTLSVVCIHLCITDMMTTTHNESRSRCIRSHREAATTNLVVYFAHGNESPAVSTSGRSQGGF